MSTYIGRRSTWTAEAANICKRHQPMLLAPRMPGMTADGRRVEPNGQPSMQATPHESVGAVAAERASCRPIDADVS